MQAQWPKLRQRLDCAWRHWINLPVSTLSLTPVAVARAVPDFITIRPPAMLPPNLRAQATTAEPAAPQRHAPALTVQASAPPPPPAEPTWKFLARARLIRNSDVWAAL